jgi:hypothetical protein
MLASFLACLCLAVVGVVGQLTDADFAKIGYLLTSELDKRDERLYAKFDAVETKIDDVKTELANVKIELTRLNYFNSHRVEIMQNVSNLFFPCSNLYGTKHTLVYKGRVATLFTPHYHCVNEPAFHPTNNGAYILHPILDLAIDLRCNPSTSALDISTVYKPSLGDEIIAYGFGDTAQVWQGLVSSHVRDVCLGPATHWNDTNGVRVCSGEIIAQGHQHAGMSGAPVLNGCGYVGVAHSVNIAKTNATHANFAYIIPASDIIDFIEQNLSELPTLAYCGQRMVTPPLAAFANCAAKMPLTPLQIIINAIP